MIARVASFFKLFGQTDLKCDKCNRKFNTVDEYLAHIDSPPCK